MLRQLMISLILEGRIRTTVARAKELRRHLERLVTYGKKGDLHHFRLILAKLGNHKEAARRLFLEIAPQYHHRAGGYLRILKLGFRRGDAAPLALVEWVSEEGKKSAPSREEGKKGQGAEGKKKGKEEKKKGKGEGEEQREEVKEEKKAAPRRKGKSKDSTPPESGEGEEPRKPRSRKKGS